MAKGSRPGGSGGGAAQKPTNARTIENMNEAQLNREIEKQEAYIARMEKTMKANSITDTAEAKALQNAFPLGVGGDGWTAERKKARDRGLERDVKRAKEYTEAYSNKESAETRLKNLQNAKEKVAGTGKTANQINEANAKKAVESAPKNLKWTQTQKGGWSNGGYSPKIIKAGAFEIHGSDGLYTIYKDGKQLGRTDKLSKAKAYVEKVNAR